MAAQSVEEELQELAALVREAENKLDSDGCGVPRTVSSNLDEAEEHLRYGA